MLKDDLLQKIVQDIAQNHRKIIDDWSKAYLAQLYEEGADIKPGCFTLNEQVPHMINEKFVQRYWFEPGIPEYESHPWQTFLDARAHAIKWMVNEMYCTDAMILERLKMDETQVRMIREYMEKENDE